MGIYFDMTTSVPLPAILKLFSGKHILRILRLKIFKFLAVSKTIDENLK